MAPLDTKRPSRYSMKSTKNVSLIVGATSEIAIDIAIQLTKRGNSIILYGRNIQQLGRIEKLITSIGGSSFSIEGSVLDSKKIENILDNVEARFGKLRHIFYSAGYCAKPCSLEFLDINEFKRTFDVNVIGFFYLVKSIFSSNTRSIDVYALTSGLGLRGHVSLGAYSASKHALEGLVKSAALEYPDRKNRFIRINPGGVNTKMLRNLFGASTSELEMTPDYFASALMKIVDGEIIVKNGNGVRIEKDRLFIYD